MVKFTGGREGLSLALSYRKGSKLMPYHALVVGLLKGYDQLMNLVLDEVKETLRGGLCLITYIYFTNWPEADVNS